MNQLNLFDELDSKKYAIIYCSCIMKDQFGVTWEKQEIVKFDLSQIEAESLKNILNENKLSSKSYYKIVEINNINFLLNP